MKFHPNVRTILNVRIWSVKFHYFYYKISQVIVTFAVIFGMDHWIPAAFGIIGDIWSLLWIRRLIIGFILILIWFEALIDGFIWCWRTGDASNSPSIDPAHSGIYDSDGLFVIWWVWRALDIGYRSWNFFTAVWNFTSPHLKFHNWSCEISQSNTSFWNRPPLTLSNLLI